MRSDRGGEGYSLEMLLFSLNAVLPIVILSLFGFLLRRMGLIKAELAVGLNRLCFRVLLPVLLFVSLYEAEGIDSLDWSLLLFASAAIVAVYALGFAVVHFSVPDRRQKGVVWQCVYRSNFAVVGIPLAVNLYGQEGGQSAALLLMLVVPLFNVLSVIALQLYNGEGKRPAEVVADILQNPLVLSVLAALAVLGLRSLLVANGIGFRLSGLTFLYTPIKSVASVASPMAMIALGAQFSFSAVKKLLRPILIGTLMRVLVVPALVLTVACLWFPGFYGAPFASLLALFASPVAVSSAPMAHEMEGDGELASQLVVWTTTLSAVTVFGFILLFSSLGAL